MKKVSDEVSSLRQTFDARTNSNIRDRLAKYDLDNEDNYKPSNAADTMLRQTFHTKVTSPKQKDLTNSAVSDWANKKEDYSSFREKKQFDLRSPQSEKRTRR